MFYSDKKNSYIILYNEENRENSKLEKSHAKKKLKLVLFSINKQRSIDTN